MKKRRVSLAAGLACLALVGGGAATYAATVSPGSGVLLCFPQSGNVQRGVNGACPAGYSKIYVANQAAANALAARVNVLSEWVMGRFPSDLFIKIAKYEYTEEGRKVPVLFYGGLNLFPKSTVVATEYTVQNGVTRGVIFDQGVVGGDGNPRGSKPYFYRTCTPGLTYYWGVLGYNSLKEAITARTPAIVC